LREYFNLRGEHTSSTTTNGKINLQHHALRPSSASLLNRSVGRGGGEGERKRTSAFTIFVTASVIATLLLALPSFHHLQQAHAQGGEPLGPATTEIINQIAIQVASVHGGDTGQISQVLQQIALQISEDSNPGRAMDAVTQILSQLTIDAQAPVSQALSQLARQQASGQNVEQQITQIGRQVATGAPATQVLVQVAIQVGVGQNANKQITQVAQQVASGTGTDEGQVTQVMQQLAIQVANQGGDANQAITQIGQQVAEGEEDVSQSLTQIAQQAATGNVGEVNQDITQVAQQAAEEGDVS
jgi:hypothetical protein